MNELEIHDAALAISDPVARWKYLDEACGENVSLRERVEAMLSLSASSGGLPSVYPGVPESVSTGAAQIDPLLGQSLGGVKLVRVISEGGMGRVYEGRQENPRRTVAVKVVKEDLATPSLLKRFDYEAQTLAGLRHAGIAEIYFAGTFGEGSGSRPYFVMEYIANAKEITCYADDLKLGSNDRLRLFQKVCDAVAHGHINGITHRDLKPQNILVDATGQPKVIDFGIAKTTRSDITASMPGSDVGKLIGTLKYMSPEQIDADPHGIDVRSDVYALGVVLHELLTGRLPYDVGQKAIDEVARIIKQQDPTPITTVNKTLRRDVGVIAGKCLEKDKNRRYSSASELAADVGRYLAGDPIAAVAPSLWDGVVRLARKHKAAATALAGIAASLVAAVVGVSIAAVRTERAKTEARAAEDAQRELRAVAELSRDEEARHRADAEEARDLASKETQEGKRRLYLANLYLIQAALGGPERGTASKLLQELEDSHRKLHGDDAEMPLELAILRPLVEEALMPMEDDGEQIMDLTFSPDGSSLATVTWDGTISLWDPATGTRLKSFGDGERSAEKEPYPFVDVAFGSGGNVVFAVSAPGVVRIWDTATGDLLTTFRDTESPAVAYRAIAVSSDGNRVATGTVAGGVRIWDLRTKTLLDTLNEASAGIHCLTFSGDGTMLGFGNSKGAVYVWNLLEHRFMNGSADGDSGADPYLLTFRPDGRAIACAAGREVRLWNLEGNKEEHVLARHDDVVVSMAFDAAGEQLATGSADKTARIWDARSGDHRTVLTGHENAVVELAFSPDGGLLASATGDWDSRQGRKTQDAVRLWDCGTGELATLFRGHEYVVSGLSFSPDGALLASSSEVGPTRLWVTLDGLLRSPLPHLALRSRNGVGRSKAVITDTRMRISVNGFLPVMAVDEQGHPEVPQVELGTKEVVFVRDLRLPRPMASCNRSCQKGLAPVSPEFEGFLARSNLKDPSGAPIPNDSRWILGALANDGAVLIATRNPWRILAVDAATGNILATLDAPRDRPFVACSPDGRVLADGNELWDCRTWQKIGICGASTGDARAICFSNRSDRVLITVGDSAVIWDSKTATAIATLDGECRDLSLAAFSPDDALLATDSGNVVRLWDAATGKPLGMLKGHEDRLWSLAFAPDGTRLASSSDDNTLRIWGIPTGEPLLTLRGYERAVDTIVFSRDSRSLVTVDFSGRVRPWGLSNAERLQMARENQTPR